MTVYQIKKLLVRLIIFLVKIEKNILITGCAGFIGYHVVNNLISNDKFHVIGVDNINNYYDVNLKKSRLKNLLTYKNFKFYKLDINNKKKFALFVKNTKLRLLLI